MTTTTTITPQAVFDRYFDAVRRLLLGQTITGWDDYRRFGRRTGEVKLLFDIENNDGKTGGARMGTEPDPEAIGVSMAHVGRFRMEVVCAGSAYRAMHGVAEVPYTMHEYLRRLIDNFIARGGELPEPAAAA